MPRPSPSRWVSLVAWGVAGAVACAPSAEVRSCATSDECPAGSRCLSSTCVANAPPSVAVAVPANPEANALLSFDASASTDLDPGDAIVSFAWTFRALSGETCAPPVVAGTGPLANVRFGCPGRYAVDVTATDRMGGDSTVTEEFEVAAYDGPALLTVSDDIVVDHLCTPAAGCAPTAPVTLSASAPGAPGPVTFAWTVEPPPDRALAPYRRVAFSPSAADPSPGVTIETDGEAISGDWIFHLLATDAAGVIGAAAVRVSIGNRPPVVTETIPVPQHTFSSSMFTAEGAVPFSVSDPDGDTLLAPSVEARHAGDGGASFAAQLVDAPARVAFSIIVPYGAAADAEHLIGGAGLERTVVFGVSDVNGAVTLESWPIVVGNRPPGLVIEPPPFTIDHSYDPTALAYVADVPLSKWADPDGDPLFQVSGSNTGDPECPEFSVNGAARVRCRLAFTGTPAAANFAGPHTVMQAVQDPWAPAPGTSTVTFTILNRPPAITSTATYVGGACTYTNSCCRVAEGVCDANWAAVSGTLQVPSRWADPDGDPISVEVSGVGSYAPVQPLVCTPETCVLDVSITPMSVCVDSPVTYLPTTVSDGLASATGSLPVQVSCP